MLALTYCICPIESKNGSFVSGDAHDKAVLAFLVCSCISAQPQRALHRTYPHDGTAKGHLHNNAKVEIIIHMNYHKEHLRVTAHDVYAVYLPHDCAWQGQLLFEVCASTKRGLPAWVFLGSMGG